MPEWESLSRDASREVMPNPIPNMPWTDISVDFIMGLPEVQGYDAILVVCDRFTKQVHIKLMHPSMCLDCVLTSCLLFQGNK